MLDALTPALAGWVRATHGGFTPAQERALPHLLRRESLLLSSPTGSGKTLAAFLAVLDDLAREPAGERIACVYVSPLRALVNDMARNLEAPIRGAGLDVTVGIRTGDTPAAARQKQARTPPHVLVTTPESLALLLSSPKARAALVGLRWVVVDEIHAIAETKRGAQLALALERLDELATSEGAAPPVRVGLSATVSPLARVAAFLGGARPVAIAHVEPAGAPEIDVELPLPDTIGARDEDLEEATLARLESIVLASRSTLVFTNTRKRAELLAERLRRRLGGEAVSDEDEDAIRGDPDVVPHHGSMSKETRVAIEERLRRGEVRCVVASSSLELGVHAEHVERVVLVGNPKRVSRALQRAGRSGHLPGATSRATLLVDDPAELPEAFATARLARERAVEDVAIPRAPLDVLAQHLVALALDGPRRDADALALTRRASPYVDLTEEDLDAVLHHLERARLVAREGDAFATVGGRARMVYLTHAGTIPESGLLKVIHETRYVGEVEEAFAETLAPHDTFLLAGEPWRLVRADGMRLLVVPAKAGTPALPAWRGEGLAASARIAEATAHALGGLHHAKSVSSMTESAWRDFAAEQAAFSAMPRVDEAAFELFPTDEGARALVAHAWLGRRANDALARALAHRLSRQLDATVRALATDAGFALLAPRGWKPTKPAIARLLAAPLRDDLAAALAGSDLLARRFRHVATRGLLLLRREGEPLSMRQRYAGSLLRVLQMNEPEHPLVREALQETLHDALDLDAAEAWRAAVASGARPMRLLPERPCASPLGARILAPPGEARREWLRDNAERVRDWMDINRNDIVISK